MYDLVKEIARSRTEATGAGTQVLMGSGTTNTAVTYVEPFNSGAEVNVVHSLAESGDTTYLNRYLSSSTYTAHTVLASGNKAYYWIAIGPRPVQ